MEVSERIYQLSAQNRAQPRRDWECLIRWPGSTRLWCQWSSLIKDYSQDVLDERGEGSGRDLTRIAQGEQPRHVPLSKKKRVARASLDAGSSKIETFCHLATGNRSHVVRTLNYYLAKCHSIMGIGESNKLRVATLAKNLIDMNIYMCTYLHYLHKHFFNSRVIIEQLSSYYFETFNIKNSIVCGTFSHLVNKATFILI